MTLYCIYCQLWTFFTPFSIVSAFLLLTLNKTQFNVCWVPAYQLINIQITQCCNYLPMNKNLSVIEAHKKD